MFIFSVCSNMILFYLKHFLLSIERFLRYILADVGWWINKIYSYLIKQVCDRVNHFKSDSNIYFVLLNKIVIWNHLLIKYKFYKCKQPAALVFEKFFGPNFNFYIRLQNLWSILFWLIFIYAYKAIMT